MGEGDISAQSRLDTHKRVTLHAAHTANSDALVNKSDLSLECATTVAIMVLVYRPIANAKSQRMSA